MKRILRYSFFIVLPGMLIFSSCKREFSCENCMEANRPPIAHAGNDTTIIFPADSVLLDGSKSSDPDDGIAGYSWKKIAGPDTFKISNVTSVKTIVNKLVKAAYKFELTVKDKGGLSAKDTIAVLVNPAAIINRPPVANAGNDTTIILPANNANLDGIKSADPDNNITGFAWTKISGPQSFNIVKPNEVQTPVTNLEAGVYCFELKVIDAGGLFSKDTVQVTVKDQLPPTPECGNSNRPTVNAQLTPFGTLSKAKSGAAVASAGNKIVFAGGQSNSSLNCTWCESWGSSRVDIYDVVSQSWSTAELSKPRYGIAAVAVGNKIFFAGGESGDGAFNLVHSAIDIYDVSTNTWAVAALSEPRSYVSAAVVGKKIFFAGGEINDFQTSTRIDIFDLSTNNWSTAELSEARGGISAVTVKNKIYFAGGFFTNYWNYIPSNKIDIYDLDTDLWSTSTLNLPGGSLAAIAMADKIYWARGCDVEIRNVIVGNSSIAHLFKPGGWSIDDGQNAVIKDHKLVFYSGGRDNKFDIFDGPGDTWLIGALSQNISSNSSIISVNNTIYVAGGFVNDNPSNQVWKLEF